MSKFPKYVWLAKPITVRREYINADKDTKRRLWSLAEPDDSWAHPVGLYQRTEIAFYKLLDDDDHGFVMSGDTVLDKEFGLLVKEKVIVPMSPSAEQLIEVLKLF